MIRNYNLVTSEDKKLPDMTPDNENVFGITDEDVFFAKQRYNLHQSSPEEGVDPDILKKYFFKQYGFKY